VDVNIISDNASVFQKKTNKWQIIIQNKNIKKIEDFLEIQIE
jgi:hypothetical protein